MFYNNFKFKIICLHEICFHEKEDTVCDTQSFLWDTNFYLYIFLKWNIFVNTHYFMVSQALVIVLCNMYSWIHIILWCLGLFQWIHIIMGSVHALEVWTLSLNTELSHWKLSLRIISLWKLRMVTILCYQSKT